jgi:hypothetical protein
MKITTFAKRELGIELTPGQSRAVSEFEAGSYQQAVWRWGRRSGKSLVADILALADAITRDKLRSKLRAHEPRIAAIIAPRLEQSTEHIRNIASMVEASPRLKPLLVTQTNDELSFSNGSVIRAYPCSARSIRGGAWSSCILDELGHYVTSEEGNAAGDRILEAALPALAQFGSAGWLVAISTPLWKQGAFYKLCQRAESGRHAYIHSLHASTTEMNPAVPADWLAEREHEDPDLYRREFAAEFIDGASSYLSSEEILACVRSGSKILPPVQAVTYAGALDPAYSHDSFAMSIVHRESDTGVVVVDGCWSWTKGGHEATLDALSGIAKQYRVTALRTDQAATVPIKEGLAKRGLATNYVAWDNANKADAYSKLKVLINTSAIEFPPDDRLLQELFSLEARPTPSGMTRIAAAGSGHDDLASALAGAIAQLGGTTSPKDVAALKELNHSLATPGGSRSAFGDVTGIPGVGNYGIDRITGGW